MITRCRSRLRMSSVTASAARPPSTGMTSRPGHQAVPQRSGLEHHGARVAAAIACSTSSGRPSVWRRPQRRRTWLARDMSRVTGRCSSRPSAAQHPAQGFCLGRRARVAVENEALPGESASRRSRTTRSTSSSGTSSPAAIAAAICRPETESAPAFSRRIRPGLRWTAPSWLASRAACVPLPAPGGPSTITCGAGGLALTGSRSQAPPSPPTLEQSVRLARSRRARRVLRDRRVVSSARRRGWGRRFPTGPRSHRCG